MCTILEIKEIKVCIKKKKKLKKKCELNLTELWPFNSVTDNHMILQSSDVGTGPPSPMFFFY